MDNTLDEIVALDGMTKKLELDSPPCTKIIDEDNTKIQANFKPVGSGSFLANACRIDLKDGCSQVNSQLFDNIAAAINFGPCETWENLENSTFAQRCWIPGEKTGQTLLCYKPGDKRTFYTMPGVSVDAINMDPFMNLLVKYCPSESNLIKALQTDFSNQQSSAESLEMIYQLINKSKFKSALNMIGRLLSHHGQGVGSAHHKHSTNSEQSLKLWTLRFQLLLSLGMHNIAWQEFEPFGDLDAPDLYFDYYPEIYDCKKGSLVPFPMRLLHADMPRLFGRPTESLPRIQRIVDTINKILSSDYLAKSLILSTEADALSFHVIWKRRLDEAEKLLATCIYAKMDFRLSLEICQKISNRCKEDEIRKAQMLCEMGRVCLQLGDQNMACRMFDNFSELKKAAQIDSQWFNLQMEMNNNYPDALKTFQNVLKMDPGHIHAANNAAICLLYTGNLMEAINLLETFLNSHTQSALDDQTFCLNLCTLYDLLSSQKCLTKKAELLRLAAIHCPETFCINRLKLASS